MALVSVVLPTYDRWPLVGEAVQSVLGQEFQDFELVVVDDGSSDGTADRLRGLDPRLRIVRQENAGRSAARNRGIALASSPYVAFLDSDDLYEPWHLAQFAAAGGDAGDRVFAAPVLLWNPASGGRRLVQPPRYLPSESRTAALVGMKWSLPGLVAPIALIRRLGAFDESLDGSEDWHLLARLCQVADVTELPRASVLVRNSGQRSMADVDWDLEWRREATRRLLDELRLDRAERVLLQAGTHRYAAARLYEVGRMAEARVELAAVRRLLGLRALRWTLRLWAQSLAGRSATKLGRRLGRRMGEAGVDA